MRGYQRRVIFLKNTGSALFDEAYFVMRSYETAGCKSEADMVAEASRIIDENFGKKKIRLPRLLTLLFAFFGGALLTLIAALIFF